MSSDSPLIVALGGATRPGSSTELALQAAVGLAEARGARTLTFGGPWLAELPIYRPEAPIRNDRQLAFIEAIRAADGIIIATPSYHAGPSGLVKNALDVIEDLRTDARPYLDGRAAALIVTSGGGQGGALALQALRATIHALRGWPTPLGVVLDTASPAFGLSGDLLRPKDLEQMRELARQLTTPLARPAHPQPRRLEHA
ncbi:NADPH-dependent FMN reductase [Phenylobacterium sp.]|jgi:FMN reductase|uniref:NADPH-dependent FMN reductase n=1 Tax=Phenylobacterium sp. TaxID=1871053 RepID=UPI0037831EF7